MKLREIPHYIKYWRGWCWSGWQPIYCLRGSHLPMSNSGRPGEDWRACSALCYYCNKRLYYVFHNNRPNYLAPFRIGLIPQYYKNHDDYMEDIIAKHAAWSDTENAAFAFGKTWHHVRAVGAWLVLAVRWAL